MPRIFPRRVEPPWMASGSPPWDDDVRHKDFPHPWKWGEESKGLWLTTFDGIRQLPTTILHDLQERVIVPQGRWNFSIRVLDIDPAFPLDLEFKPGDRRFRGPDHLDIFLSLAAA